MTKLLHFAAKPVEYIASTVHLSAHRRLSGSQLQFNFARAGMFRRLLMNRKIYHLSFGSVVMFFGTWLFHRHPSVVGDSFWETVAAGLQGMGGAPIVKHVADFFRIEV